MREQALINNQFSMVNEASEYFSKLLFYESKIESLQKRKNEIEEKLRGKFDVIEGGHGYKSFIPKVHDYMCSLKSEITYDIEA